MTNETGKNIVICLDGTGNQFKEHNTNVVTLYRILERAPGVQVAYYDPGVGTLADPTYRTPVAKRINKALGLAFGRGLTRNVQEAYSYLMDQYVEGDRLFLFGFSRGAYTARVLAGFINSCGILEPGCQNLIPYAMKQYKKTDWEVTAKFRSTYGRKVSKVPGTRSEKCRIFLGLWDSVSTFGWVYDPVFLPHTSNNRSVDVVRHALAIDEKRAFFRPLHWGAKFRDRQDVKEVWFAGVHSDVGGGYPEVQSGLAKIPLRWMITEAVDGFGLLVDEGRYRRYVLGKKSNGESSSDYVGPSHEGMIHKSLKKVWWCMEFVPKRIWDHDRERKVLRLPRPSIPRSIVGTPNPVLHHSVLDRMHANLEKPYEPGNLPDCYDVESKCEQAGKTS